MAKFFLKLYHRLIFIIQFRTLKSVTVLNNDYICVSTSKGNYKVIRRCPHQGAFLENGFIKDYIIQCHWHGCKLNVSKKGTKV